jgi:hypothetical protein
MIKNYKYKYEKYNKKIKILQNGGNSQLKALYANNSLVNLIIQQKLLSATRYIFREGTELLSASSYLRVNQKKNNHDRIICTDEFDYLFTPRYIDSIDGHLRANSSITRERDEEHFNELLMRFVLQCNEKSGPSCDTALGCVNTDMECQFNIQKAIEQLYYNINSSRYIELLKSFLKDEIPFNIHYRGPLSTESHNIRELLIYMIDNYFIPYDSQPGLYLIDKQYYQKPYIILSSNADNIANLLNTMYITLNKRYIKIESINERNIDPVELELIDVYFTVENNDWNLPFFNDICESIYTAKINGLINPIISGV